MVQINFAQKTVNVKIVYYGPGMSGKTTNLEVIHQRAPESNRGDLTSISTDGDRTLFFDYMPLDLGTVAGMRTAFQLYTVPGQVYYNSTRKLVLQGVDGIIFVADSSASMVNQNLESLRNLEENLNEYGKSLATLPHVIQLNKRDLPDALTVEELSRMMNAHNAPLFEAVANTGQGVFPTLKALAARVLESIHSSSGGGGAPAPQRPAAPPAPRLAPSPSVRAPAAPLPAQQPAAQPQPAMQRTGFQQPAYAQPQQAAYAPQANVQPLMGGHHPQHPQMGHPMQAQPMHGQPQGLTQTGFQPMQSQFHPAQPQPPSTGSGGLQLAGRGPSGGPAPSRATAKRPASAQQQQQQQQQRSAPPPRPANGALEGTRFRPRGQGGAAREPRPTPAPKGGKLPQSVLVVALVVLAVGVTYAVTKFL
jgi:signal recognition particle receptor subunit beta